MTWASAASFYDQMRTLLTAGMPLPRALELAGDSSRQPHRELGKRWAGGCASGGTLADQLSGAQEPAFVTALVRAGETSGRLADLCGEIAVYYRHAMSLRSLVIGRLVYPVLLLHMALIIPTVPKVFLGNAGPWTLLMGPAPLWLLAAVVFVVMKSLSPQQRGRVMLLPGLRFLTLPLVCGNTCLVLHAALRAGMLIPNAVELAADACGNQVMAKRLRTASVGMRAEQIPDLASALSSCSFLPEVIALISNGERSGTLEGTLQRCTVMLQESFRQRSEWAARIFTGIIYGVSLLVAGLAVVQLYGSYLGAAKSVANSINGE